MTFLPSFKKLVLAGIVLVGLLGMAGHLVILKGSRNAATAQLVSLQDSRVLAIHSANPENPVFEVNAPAFFNREVFLRGAYIDGNIILSGNIQGENSSIDMKDGTVTASNLVYSLQGQRGDLTLTAGEGIAIDGLTVRNTQEQVDMTLDGLNYLTIDNHTITAHLIDLEQDITGILSVNQGGTGTAELSDIQGTPNQIAVINGTNRIIGGNVALSLPQDIHTGASPTFTQLGLGTSPTSGALHVVGQCVTGDTKLRRRRRRRNKRGEWEEEWEEVPITDIKPGDDILSLNEKTGEFVPARVNKLIPMPVQASYLLVTQSGKKIRTTAEHPYLIAQRPNKSAHAAATTFEVDQSGRLERTGEDSVVALANNDQAVTAFLSKEEKKVIRQTRFSRHKKLMGPGLLAAVIIELIAVSGVKVTRLVIDKEYEGHDLRIARAIMAVYPEIVVSFKQIGHVNSPAHEAAVQVYNRKKPAKASIFLKAMSDSDLLGSSDSGSHHRGLVTADSRTLTTSNSSVCDLLDVSSEHQWVLAKSIRAGMRLATIDGWESITAVYRIGTHEPMYDIEIEGTHNFVGNDIVAHNTYLGGDMEVTGTTTLNGLTYSWPGTQTADGLLTTDGAGNLTWGSISGAGGMESFDVSDGTDTETVADGQTLQILGGTGMLSTVSPARTVTVTLDTSYADNRYVNITGDTMTGALNLPSNGLAVGTNQLVVSGGNVGIGTATPTAGRLHVIGQCVTGDTRLRRRRKRKRAKGILGGSDDDLKKAGVIFDNEYIYDEIEITHVKENDEIASLDQTTGEFTWSKVNKLMSMGTKSLIRITTTTGRQIRTTAEHPYFVRTKAAQEKETQKLYRFEVDMSMKIESFTSDSVIAVANSDHAAVIRLPASLKQRLRDNLRRYNTPQKMKAAMFAATVVEALQRMSLSVHELVIDEEYSGHDGLIADIITSSFPVIEISFALVGKKSPAHFAAYGAHKRKKDANFTASAEIVGGITENALRTPFHVHKVACSGSPRASLSTNLHDGREFVNSGTWIKVKELKAGQHIAVAHGDTPAWEKIVKVEFLPAEGVYDVEIEGTHNFIGNDIVAHNTYLGGDMEVTGTTTLNGLTYTWPGTQTADGLLTTDGLGNLTWGSISGAGGMESFDVSDGTDTETVADGQTLQILGGTGMLSAVSPTRTVTVTLDTSYADGRYVNITGDTMTGALNLPSNGLAVGTNQLVVSGGNVGIGMTGPQHTFAVHNGGTGVGNDAPAASFGNQAGHLENGAWTGIALSRNSIARETAGILLERVGAFQKLHLAITGNSGGSNQINISDARLTVNHNGNVGIGTTSPTAQLQVHTSSASEQALIIRGAASQSANLQEWQDSAGSVFASISSDGKRLRLNDNTQAVYLPGNNSVFIGNGGASITDANEIVSVGINALFNLTSGNRNTAIGYDSLLSLTIGSNNTAVGRGALRANTLGHRNTAIGTDAMRLNISGLDNVALGYNTLSSNTTGQRNIAMGRDALTANTTGSFNTAIGYDALRANNSSLNVAIGYSALRVTTGTRNAGFGAWALGVNGIGSDNIAVGYEAGRYQSDGVTALANTNNSIYIGAESKGLDDNDNNSIVIGYQAIGIGANTVILGNDDIVTTALKGNVGIGMISPDAQLQVHTSSSSKVAQIIRGAASQSANLTEWQNSAGTALSVVDKDGNVGIGTTPDNPLHIARHHLGYAAHVRNTHSNNGGDGLLVSLDTGAPSFRTILRLESANVARFRVLGNGDAIISGTLTAASPQSLTVVSTGDMIRMLNSGQNRAWALRSSLARLNIRGYTTPYTTGVDYVTFNFPDRDNGGIMGINEQSPAATLHIVGHSTSKQNLIIQGVASQTANLTEWQDSAGTVRARVTAASEFSNTGGFNNSEIFGLGATVNNAGSTAIGRNAFATSTNSVAIGYNANSGSSGGIAIGHNSEGSPNAIAIGSGATITGNSAIAIGAGTSVGNQFTVVLGAGASANANSISLGHNASSLNNGVALGVGTSGAGHDVVVIGHGASITARYGNAIGRNATAGNEAIAIGALSTASGNFTAALGHLASAANRGAIAIGHSATTGGVESIAIGRGAATSASAQMVVGSSAFPISDIFFGKGVTNTTPTAYTIHGTGGSGTDVAGGALQFAGGRGTGTGAGGEIVFQTAAASGSSGSSLNSLTERMRIDSTGNVGIGTTSPTANLEVKGQGARTIRVESSNGTTAALELVRSGPGNDYRFIADSGRLDILQGTDGVTFGTKLMSFSDGKVAVGSADLGGTLNVKGLANGTVAYLGAGSTIAGAYNDLALSVTSNADMRYAAGLRVTNTQGAPSFLNPRLGLFVQNTDTFLPADRIERLSILTSGNVGIGTTSPQAPLHVLPFGAAGTPALGAATVAAFQRSSSAGTAALVSIISGNAGQGNLAFGDTDAEIVGLIRYDHSDNSMRLFTTGTEKVRIDSSGNIGIGMTEPTAQLQVHTSSASKVAQIIRGAASQTANLTEWQDSAGTVLASVSADGKRLRLDANTQAVYIPGGDFTGTMVMGDGGGNLSHVSGNDGRYNTFIGLQAGRDNTTGRNNMALGYQSLRDNASGNFNTAVGYGALTANTSSNNTAVGLFALTANTTGPNNTAVGTEALDNNTTGNSNVAIGYQALRSHIAGNFNTAIGREAGRLLVDGSGNQTSNRSVFLGYGTRAFSAGNDNQIAIGYLAFGLGSNTVVLGNDSIVTTALKGNVGIGTTGPDAQLQVHTSSASKVAQVIRGAASQTANLTEWQDSAGTPGARIDSALNFSRPGSGSNSEQFGAGASATGADSVAIGRGAVAYNRDTVVGRGATGNSGNSWNTLVGYGASSTANEGVGLGHNVSIGGSNAIAIGYAASAAHSGSIVLGRSTVSTAANQLVIGSSFASWTAVNNVFIGKGVTSASPSAITFNATGGSGTDVAGGELQFAGGRGTGTGAGGEIVFQTAGSGGSSGSSPNSLSERMRINSDGNIGIGTTSPDERLHVAGKVKIDTFDPDTGSAVCFNASNTLVDCSGSSSAFKTNTKTLPDTLSEVLQMKPVTFTWKDSGQEDFGFIAQDIAKINPLYATFKNGQPHGVRYDRLTAVIVKAVQEQHKRIEVLEDKVAQIQAGRNTSSQTSTEQLEVLTVESELIVGGRFAVQGAASFYGDLIADTIDAALALNVHGDTAIAGDLKVEGTADFESLSNRHGGFVTVKAGETRAEVQFDQPFKTRPAINASPFGNVYSYWFEAVTESGFYINIAEPLEEDVEFSWTAFGIEQ